MGGAEGFADLARLQAAHHVAELRHVDVGIRPAQLAALYRGTRILGVLLRHAGEARLAALDVVQDAVQGALGLLLAQDDGGLDQDVTGLHLGLHHLLLTLGVEDLDDVQAGAGAQRADDVAFLGTLYRFGHQGGHLLRAHPAPVTPFQGLGAVTLGDGQLAEIRPLFQGGEDAFDLGLGGVELFGIRVVRQGNLDVADMI